ncbi:hypothetical protein ACG1VR_12760 [Cedecea davisae]|uniref:hypothetical protein n=1 Tax=Cedecea TaxID=158483 RepID=UPI000F83B13D
MFSVDTPCKIEAGRIHYNERRPHSTREWMTSYEFAESLPVTKICSQYEAGYPWL